ncbi:hypothetical protein Trydic_g22860 [Trypoxylus dichotomus]
MNLLILVSSFTIVFCRPQIQKVNQPPADYDRGEDIAVNYLEQQMLDNLKSIILKSQLPPNIEGITFNPLVQSLPHENTFVQYRKPDVIYGSSGYINNIPNMPWNVYQYEGYSPDKEIETSPVKANTPMTLYNSLTTITEYENDEEKCKTKINQINSSNNLRNGKSFILDSQINQQKYIVDVDKSIEVAAFTEESTPVSSIIVLHKEDSQNLKNQESHNSLLNNVNQFYNNRSEKKLIKPTNQNIKDDQKVLNPLQLFIQHQQNKDKFTTTTEASSKDVINENSKKVLSKDNTGSGIFIQRLKVRKGGVAIAGPGGIATAGSGGTAIVGPNGFAYTHPDSLAIAGTGSRVIAVDPKVNLGDIVKGKEDVTRVGKLVAVGPNTIRRFQETGSYANLPKSGRKRITTDLQNRLIERVPLRGRCKSANEISAELLDELKIGISVRSVRRRNSDRPVKITSLPYYGGAYGQLLEIYETADGKISTQIITRLPDSTTSYQLQDEARNYTALEFPELPSKYDSEYSTNIKNLHRSALNIIQLQENAKKRGTLTDNEQIEYDKNTKVLNKAAKDLAELQLADDDDLTDDEGLKQWFERKKGDKQKPSDNKKKGTQKPNKKEEEKEKEKEKEKPSKGEEEEEEGDEDDENSDSVIINLPPDDASVAEAKPVGLAVAGAGGIAESQPVATAVVGPAGLAIARPVATAIAGVSPDQALVPIYVEGLVKPTKKKDSAKGTKKTSEATDFLSRIISKYHQV